MNERKQRPGVMLYFDTLCPALARLTNEQRGELLQGIVGYAQSGTIPELDGMTGMAFDLLRPGIDRDGERYEAQRIHGQYMAYCRSAKERGERVIGEDEFKQRLLATDSYCQVPTTSPTASASTPTASAVSAFSNSKSSLIPSPAAAAQGKGVLEGCKGDERENPQTLFERFLEAVDAGEQDRACSLSNRLFSLGYDADQRTRRLTRRT